MMDIVYNKIQTIRFEFPVEWANVTGVDVEVFSRGGDELLASAAMTLASGGTITGAASPGDQSITVSQPVETGDVFTLAGQTAEQVKVTGYASGTATIAEPLYYAHGASSALSPMFATYSLDATDTDVFSLSREVTFKFTPNTGAAVTDAGEVLNSEFNSSAIEDEFRTLYPNEYNTFRGESFSDFYEICLRRVKNKFALQGIDLDKLPEQQMMNDYLLDYMRYQILLTGGDRLSEEFETMKNHLELIESQILSSPIWVDADQDLAEEEGEVDRHAPKFYARGF
jgi:hypothetical protein